ESKFGGSVIGQAIPSCERAQNNFSALSSRPSFLPPRRINHTDNKNFISVEMSAHLTAVYTSPTATNTFSSPLQSAPTQASSSTEKSQYLADLRQKVAQLQDDINQFLTKKMDQDKAATEGAASKDEDMEEQMYGEEVVDED
ncbi:hypothetical protein KCU97_g21111, partial [Aureobasidium melanogenum]